MSKPMTIKGLAKAVNTWLGWASSEYPGDSSTRNFEDWFGGLSRERYDEWEAAYKWDDSKPCEEIVEGWIREAK